MPTATEFFGFTALNYGPLTTTYTAPASCATKINYPLIVNATSPYPIVALPVCTAEPYGDCLPSYKELESSDLQTSTFFQGTLAYYSPGIACPAGWETVGLLAHDEGSKFSASGVLATPAMTYSGMPRAVEVTEFWKNILDTSETLAYCCPSGYQGDERRGCMSTLGPVASYTYSKHCSMYGHGDKLTIISSVEGLTYSEGVISRLEPTRALAYTTTMVDLEEVVGEAENGFGDLMVATWVPVVPLVYKQSDMEKKEEDSDESGTRTATATGEGGNENAASSPPRQGLVSTLGLMLGVLVCTGMLCS
ncbi:Ff.00g035040.m01.CDS01 [Fusarium sp. VM40]|nr:Ff.00g035040.m01.CDS01 [Fusarium sp. VM40]